MGTCTMYYNDLAPCSYFGLELADKLVAMSAKLDQMSEADLEYNRNTAAGFPSALSPQHPPLSYGVNTLTAQRNPI